MPAAVAAMPSTMPAAAPASAPAPTGTPAPAEAIDRPAAINDDRRGRCPINRIRAAAHVEIAAADKALPVAPGHAAPGAAAAEHVHGRAGRHCADNAEIGSRPAAHVEIVADDRR